MVEQSSNDVSMDPDKTVESLKMEVSVVSLSLN